MSNEQKPDGIGQKRNSFLTELKSKVTTIETLDIVEHFIVYLLVFVSILIRYNVSCINYTYPETILVNQ